MSSGPHTEDGVLRAWKGGYAEGYRAGWDAGLDCAVTRMRDRLPEQVRAELADLAGTPEQGGPDASTSTDFSEH